MKNIYRTPIVVSINYNDIDIVTTSSGVEQSTGDCSEIVCTSVV